VACRWRISPDKPIYAPSKQENTKPKINWLPLCGNRGKPGTGKPGTDGTFSGGWSRSRRSFQAFARVPLDFGYLGSLPGSLHTSSAPRPAQTPARAPESDVSHAKSVHCAVPHPEKPGRQRICGSPSAPTPETRAPRICGGMSIPRPGPPAHGRRSFGDTGEAAVRGTNSGGRRAGARRAALQVRLLFRVGVVVVLPGSVDVRVEPCVECGAGCGYAADYAGC